MSVVAAQNTAADRTPHCAPPVEIGPVLYAAGDPADPPGARSPALMAGVGACLGAVVGLVGSFVVMGLYERSHGLIAHRADWFLAAMIGGPILGAVLGFVLEGRPRSRTSRFVGELGCAVVGKRVELLRFADVRAMTTRPLAMGPLTLRAVYVTDRSGRERRWLIMVDPAQASAAASEYSFGDAALAATPPFRSGRRPIRRRRGGGAAPSKTCPSRGRCSRARARG